MLTDALALEMVAAVAIVVADLGCAASHMAYVSTFVPELAGWEREGKTLEIPPMRLPIYDKHLPVCGDLWHLVAGLRYVALGMLAWLAFGWEWEWYLGTALINSIGWQGIKRLHGKDWTLGMLVRRWLS